MSCRAALFPPRAMTVTWLVAALLSGCAVGPDYIQPEEPKVSSFTEHVLPHQTVAATTPGGDAQRFVAGEDLPTQWWTVFRSAKVNELVERALKANPNLQAADAALRVVQENVRVQMGAYVPSLNANFQPTRQKVSGELSSNLSSGDYLYNLHTAQLNVSYTLDVFGLNRRQTEALLAQEDYQRYQLRAAHLTLTSNVVAAAVQIASLRGQIDVTESTLKILESQLEIFQKQLALGAIPEANVIAQQATIAQARATLPTLKKQLVQQEDLLAALTGHLPAETKAPSIELKELTLPAELPVSLPSQLVHRRPDILSAEAQLHTASAQIGVAVANMYPQVTLSGNWGSAATDVVDLFKAGTKFWNIAGSLTQPIFQGGQLLHKKRSAEAAYDQALAQYHSAVLSAFQNVADCLHALDFDAQILAAAAEAERATSESLGIARKQVELGDASYLNLLTAEQAYQQARLNTVQARANRFADTAALFQALGGGWVEGQKH